MERKSLRMMKSIKVSSEEMVKWPPRSYICSFCKREFRSAQALGGHMNVHRKERARQLILSPPPLLTNNHRHFDINVSAAQPCEESWIRQRSPSTSPSKMLSPFAASAVVSPSRSSISRPSWGEIKKRVSNFKKDAEVSNLGLDLEIGNMLSDSKKHLDLELRLGYSNN